MENIDKVFYINLEHRKDRYKHIIQELKSAGFDELKIVRIDAVYTPDIGGSYGCILSHIKALKTFLEDENNKICMVFEDDFKFFENPQKKFSNLFMNNTFDWDILSLAYNPNGCNMIECNVEGFLKVIKHGTASGYLLKRSFVQRLIDNYEESRKLIEIHGQHHFACLDVNWYKLQSNSKWYAFKPALGFQMESFSDIEKKFVDYKC